MDVLFVFFRVIHIFGAVLWVGSAIFYLFLVEPSVKALGPNGGKFMEHLIGKARYPIYMSTVSLATILSGAYLFVVDSGGLQVGWLQTQTGIVYTIGSVVGIGVYLLGFLMIRPRADRLSILGREIGASGGSPSPAQAVELQKLDREMAKIGQADFIMLSIALLAMAIARYF